MKTEFTKQEVENLMNDYLTMFTLLNDKMLQELENHKNGEKITDDLKELFQNVKDTNQLIGRSQQMRWSLQNLLDFFEIDDPNFKSPLPKDPSL